jgi:hypothetical protein
MIRVLLVTLILFALGVVPGGHAETFAVDGQTATVIRPQRSTDRLVLFVHGAGGDHESIVENEAHLAITQALLRHGFAVAASEAHGEENLGEPRQRC